MSADITALLDSTASALIIDSHDYARRVLLQDRDVPWADPTAAANHLGQAQALLPSALVVCRIDELLLAAANDPARQEALTQKSRPGYAARALLADEELRTQIGAVITTLVRTQKTPVAVQIPGPTALLRAADDAVSGGNDFDGDDAENASMYLSDWLRAVAAADIAALILDERTAACSADACQPVANLCEHRAWPWARRSVEALQFVEPAITVPVLDPGLLTAAESETLTGPALMEIPRTAVPEEVLAGLARLRGEDA